MMIEISILIAVIGCAVGVAGFFRGRDGKIATDSEWKGTVNAKLDLLPGIKEDISALKGEVCGQIEELRADVHELRERVTVVEQSTKSAHKRVDTMEGKK